MSRSLGPARWWGVALAALALAGPGEAPAKPSKRFGIEGEIVAYDAARKVLKVKVIGTKVAGRFATGNTVGGKAPGDVKRLDEVEFAVEPEGSVLRRTVIKAATGGGLDNSGTPEGFQQALERIPDDRPVVMSCEPNEASGDGVPKYKVKMIQLQYTQEELMEYFDRISKEVD